MRFPKGVFLSVSVDGARFSIDVLNPVLLHNTLLVSIGGGKF
jgi:hypothetical protein